MIIEDLSGTMKLDKSGTWYANGNQISEYLSCVSYIAAVRTKEGKIWRYKPEEIKQELNSIQISYEEGYSPSTSSDE